MERLENIRIGTIMKDFTGVFLADLSSYTNVALETLLNIKESFLSIFESG